MMIVLEIDLHLTAEKDVQINHQMISGEDRTRDSSNERGMNISRSGSVLGRDSYDYPRIKSDRGPPPFQKFCVGNERVAYVYFRTFEEARDARHSKLRLILFDKPAQIEPVFDRGASDMAHRGKVEMSGQYIGKFQCKIGYGKTTPTTRIWVGGLGTWASLQHLEKEFDRFGAIRKIDFVKGENHAYIQYDSIDAAQAACQEMRGFPLGGPDKRLRVDFADPGPYSYYQSPSRAGFREEEGYAPPLPSKRPFRNEVPPNDDYYGGIDNNWSRNNMYENQSYDSMYDRSPKFQGRDSWGAPEDDERHDYRGWNRNNQGWWDDHPRGGRKR
ncbi:RNA-binding protein spenito [Caerostris extrusa]|uniref:RNA-binding protein spenito n=1 Tax=Caerostris extrusa TaxID=172846 RepID=A0AAV4XND1_CAEEX|nr:RNA-binding protein spenito [Caerostris extrusa]